MKIANFLFKISITLMIFAKISLSLKTRTGQLMNNQLKDYPNTYEAPVSSQDLEKANFTEPLLSRALFEENPERKIRQKEFMEVIKYSLYKMSRGEVELIFNFADLNHDDLIDQAEWDAFTTLFVLPYEACDDTADYLLDDKEFKNCFDSDPRSKLVSFPENYETSKYKILMYIVSTRNNLELNFSDYLIIRRALFGWKECHSASMYISKNSFKCALKSSIPIKYHLKIESDLIYDAGMKVANNKGAAELDFISYVRTLYFAYVFSILNLPNDIAYLEKNQFKKAIKEDRFPTFFNEEEVEFLYEITNVHPFQQNFPMSLNSFFFFFNFHRLFHRYASKKNRQINYNELNNLINDYLFPTPFRFAIDQSKTGFNKTDYLEVSMVLQRLRLNERDFYFSFKNIENEDMLKKTNSSITYDEYFDYKEPDETNRRHFFMIMTTPDKQYWTKQIFYRAMVSLNLFVELTTDQRFLVSVSTLLEKLPSSYDSIYPPINIFQRENYLTWKKLPRENHIDLLLFLIIENYKFKFNVHKLNKYEVINETLLKIIMKDYGWDKIPDTVIDLAKRGYDQLRRRIYIVKDVFNYMAIVQSYALENHFNKIYTKMFKIDKNLDISRRFPNFPRRHASSPLV